MIHESRIIDHHLTLVTNNDETLRVGDHLLNIETVAWIVTQGSPEFTIRLTVQNLTLVCTHKVFTVQHLAMSGVVLRDMTVFLLGDHPPLVLKVVIFLNVVTISLVARDEDDILVLVGEGDLCAERLPSWVEYSLACDASLLVHLPDIDCLLRLTTERYKKFVVLGTEIHGDEGLMLFDLSGADDFTLFENLSIRLALLAALTFVFNAIDGDNRRLVTLLSDSESLTIFSDGHRGDTFRSFNTGVGFLSFIFNVEDDYVMSGWVNNMVIVEEEDAIFNITLHSRNELGCQSDLWVLRDRNLAS